ncbi:methyl-accepting chemotaxis protein [Lederbergia galactosidilytica]|uniref:methyl-accepting chemotaxis protein n=1 Tax=Lederbergia galactosidilytica TaxID=217031 RepID=UPI0007171FD9|nr:methyl-accepting chemotaxis protein [Lederbergia galactosidilytica]MBP1917001.1 methyl-accepting chemotaxis protein [Lederbergia galactosidilytica]
MLKQLTLKNIKIGWKFGLTLVLVFILFGISTSITAISLKTIEKNIDIVKQSGDRSVKITEMGTLLREKGIRIVNYVQEKDSALIDEYEAQRVQFDALQEEISKDMKTDEQKDLFAKVVANDKKINEIFTGNVIPTIEAGNVDLASIPAKSADQIQTETVRTLDILRETVNEEQNLAVTEAESSQKSALLFLLISMVASILIGGLLVYIISSSISRNLNKVLEMSNRIAEGDLAVQPIEYDGQDEIGKLASAMNRMSVNLRNVIQEVANVSETVNSHSEELMQTTNELNEGSEQIASTMQELSAGAETQASHSTTLNEMMESFNTKIVEANKNGQDVETTANKVLSMAEEGRVLMNQSVKQMEYIHKTVSVAVQNVKGLNEGSKKISTLTEVIQEIAEQTNLLSLNAAIEAARAGEHGKGFAVVASEVRKLAEQVSQSVGEITGITGGILEESNKAVASLESSYSEVENGSKQIEITGSTFGEIHSSVSSMADKVHHITDRLQELTGSSQEMSQSIEEVAAVAEESATGVEQAAASTEQSSSAMEEISGSASELATLSEQLNIQVNNFKI